MRNGEHLVIRWIVFFVYLVINDTIINSILQPVFGIQATEIWLIGIFTISLGSVFPDRIEPPLHWTHRSTFHSKRALAYSWKLFVIMAIIALLFSPFFYISCFFLGYTLHLLADSTTKMGLPA